MQLMFFLGQSNLGDGDWQALQVFSMRLTCDSGTTFVDNLSNQNGWCWLTHRLKLLSSRSVG